MKFFYLLFLLSISVFAQGETTFSPFVEQQIALVEQINKDTATRETVMEVAKKQEQIYSLVLENIIEDKESYLQEKNSHSSEIFALQKIIKLNKRHGNKYAVMRDEVLVKSYQILDAQNMMIKEILQDLDKYEYEEFQVKSSQLFAKNQISIQSITKKYEEYEKVLKIKSASGVVAQAQKNIKIFYAIIDINTDILKYFSIFDKKLYTLNKYSQFKIIKPILYINNLEAVKIMNKMLAPFQFNVVKILIIISLILFVYFIRKVLYNLFEKYIVEINSLKKYSKDILGSIKKLVEIAIIFINIELILYVYNDFVTIPTLSKLFNIAYGFLFTYIVYRVANVIATIKINEIHLDSKSIKYEVINVGIKIINFTIWIIGLLLMLFLAGVNLTAVLSGLGIGGFAVALAAKDSLANFFGTLSILLSDVFSQGDWIEVDGKEGTVVEIGLRVTTLRTFDNAIVSIPNALVANNDVRNWNRRSLGRRIKMSLGVKYDSKMQDLKNAIEDIYVMLDKHPDIATRNTAFEYSGKNHKARAVRSKDDEIGVKKTLLVYLDEFGDSSLNILVYAFSKTVVWSEWLETKQDIMFKIMEIFEKNNLEFAFPSLSIYPENN